MPFSSKLDFTMPEDMFWLITLHCIQRETGTCNFILFFEKKRSMFVYLGNYLVYVALDSLSTEQITSRNCLAWASNMLKQMLSRFCDNARPRSCFALFTLNRSHYLEKASALDFIATWCCELVKANYL